MYEESAGVPLIVAGEEIPSGKRIDVPVFLLDVLVLSEYHGMGSTTGAFMIRSGRYNYVHYVAYRPQLFDLETDPEEPMTWRTIPPMRRYC